ncbi:MAG TPA: MarR family transcriptional regulator, partial [Advenella sp.]|nr:MarR family transcriptional regulator [Advenella sp.]
IALSPGKLDKRKVIASLTSEGQALLSRTIPRAQEISRLTMGKLNPAEQVAILYLLQKMNASGLQDE